MGLAIYSKSAGSISKLSSTTGNVILCFCINFHCPQFKLISITFPISSQLSFSAGINKKGGSSSRANFPNCWREQCQSQYWQKRKGNENERGSVKNGPWCTSTI